MVLGLQNLQRRTCALVPRGGRLYRTHNCILAQRMHCSAATGKNQGSARAAARVSKPKRNCSTTPDLHTYQHSVLSGRALLLLRCCSDSLASLGRAPPRRLPACTERRASWHPAHRTGPSPAPPQYSTAFLPSRSDAAGYDATYKQAAVSRLVPTPPPEQRGLAQPWAAARARSTGAARCCARRAARGGLAMPRGRQNPR